MTEKKTDWEKICKWAIVVVIVIVVIILALIGMTPRGGIKAATESVMPKGYTEGHDR